MHFVYVIKVFILFQLQWKWRATALWLPFQIQAKGKIHHNPTPTPTPETLSARNNLQQSAPSWREMQQSNNVPVDIMFLIDGSTNIHIDNSNNFNLLKAWIGQVASGFDIRNGNIQIGLIQYSFWLRYRNLEEQEFIRTEIDLGSCRSISCFEERVQRIRLLTYPAYTGAAINKTVMVDFARARPNSKKIIVLVTNDRSHDDVYYASTYARNQNITIFSIGISSSTTSHLFLRDLQLISNGEVNNNWRVYQVAGFNLLHQIISDLQSEIKAEYENPVCPRLITPRHGVLNCTNNNEVGSICTYACLPNYKFTAQGTSSRTCRYRSGSGALWDGVPATCGGCYGRFDLLLIIDTSASIGEAHFNVIKDTLVRIIDTFHIGLKAVQISLIHLSGGEIVALWDSNWFLDRTQLLAEILNLPITSTYKNVRGLKHAIKTRMSVATGRRRNEKHISLVISDGTSTGKLADSAQYLRKVSKVLTIGLGDFRTQSLHSISSHPVNNHSLYLGPRFFNLLRNVRFLVGLLCNGQSSIEQIRCPVLLRSTDQCEMSITCSDSNRAGSHCTAHCCQGHEIQENANAICHYNGEWSTTSWSCIEKSCPALVQTDGMQINCSNANRVNSTCVTSCRQGYVLSDSWRNLNCRIAQSTGTLECLTTCRRSLIDPEWDSRIFLQCIEINECDSNPCLNNGVCSDEVNDFSCDCPTGYSGSFCQHNIDECASSPCLNGGRCIDGENQFECSCSEGYDGLLCENNFDECFSNPCRNNATCNDGINGYTCECQHGYRGENCEIGSCASSPCQHGGTCTNIHDAYACACVAGYTGANCEVDIDDCENITCVHGFCVDGVNRFTCRCHTGYGGMYCQSLLSTCYSQPCHHNATCLEISGSNQYRCACPEGFTGENCEIPHDHCNPNPCSNNGICQDHKTGFTCACPQGFNGARCENNEDNCRSVTCHNGGRCHDGIASYFCECATGYGGDHCEITINHCLTDFPQEKCLHEGTCVNTTTGYICLCQSGYSGKFCQNEITCSIDSQTVALPSTSSCIGGRRPGAVCTLHCETGMRPKSFGGNQILHRICLNNGQWSIDDFLWGCEHIRCPPLAEMLNRKLIRNRTLLNHNHDGSSLISTNCTNEGNINSYCDVSCPSGHRLVGQQFSVCLPSGQWSQTTTSCVKFQCSSFGTETGVLCTNGYRTGSVCNKTCPNGYKLRGPPYKTCLSNMSWDSSGAWECVPGCSGFPPSTPNAIYFCSNSNNIGSVCSSTCNRGFVERRRAWFNCTNNNFMIYPFWTGTIGVCEPLCDMSINLETGMTYGFGQRDGIDLISTPYLTPTENLSACSYQAHLRIRTTNLPITLRLSYSNLPRNNHIEVARNIDLNQHNRSLTAQSDGLVGFGDNLYARSSSPNNSSINAINLLLNISQSPNVSLILDWDRVSIADAGSTGDVEFSPTVIRSGFIETTFNRLLDSSVGSGLCFVCLKRNTN